MVKKYLLLFLFLIPLASAECLYYFYGEGCPGCQEVNSHIKLLQEKVPEAEINTFEVYYLPNNGEKLRELYESYKIPEESQGLPIVFFSDSYLIGKEPIFSLSEEKLKESATCPTTLPKKAVGVVGENLPLNVFQQISFTTMTAGALMDAFHPGLLALLLIMAMLLLYIKKPVPLIKKGLYFIITVYVMYFLFANSLFTWFAASDFGILFYRIIGLLAIIYGLLIWKNFLFDWKFIDFKENTQKLITRIKDGLTSTVGIIIIAIASSLFSFAKVSTTLLSMRQAFRGPTGWTSIPILFYYLLIVVIPLIIIIIVLYLMLQKTFKHAEGKKEKTETWKKHNLKVFQVIVSFFIFLLGIVVLFM